MNDVLFTVFVFFVGGVSTVYVVLRVLEYQAHAAFILKNRVLELLTHEGELSALQLSESLAVPTRKLYPILREGVLDGDLMKRETPDPTGYRGGRPRVLYRRAVPKWIPPSDLQGIM